MSAPWNIKNAISNSTSKHSLLLGLVLIVVSTGSTALPLPGSQITNIASGDFIDAQGNVQVINSNPVSLTIQSVYSFTLQQNQQQVGTIGAQVTFPHLLTNTGNSTDQYELKITPVSGFSLTGLAVYADRNQDGLPDDNINLNNTNVSLAANDSLALVVVGTVPTSASAGNQSSITLVATSQQNTSSTQTVNDVVNVLDQAVLNVTKSESVSTGTNGTTITYTLTYTNTGTSNGRLTVTDALNSSLQYQAGSGVSVNGAALTDADDNEGTINTANTGVSYRVLTNNLIEFEITNVAPLTTGAIKFTALVLPNAVQKIPNTASYTQYNGSNTTPIKSTVTNTVIFSRQDQLSVVLNNNSGSASNNGNPNNSPDNLIVKTGSTAGKDIVFDNYVWNTGNAGDIYNLTYSATNLPSCSNVQFLAGDGRTLLTDSNGDGVIDTGLLAAGQARLIKVVVVNSPTCSSTSLIDIDVTATSATNTTISDPIRNRINQIAATGISDLYNSDNSGTGLGNVDNAGNALLSKPITAGQTTVFPLVALNSGTSNNNYNLLSSGSAINLNTLATTALPAGWQVLFYEGNADCSVLGTKITNSGPVAAGATKQYCAVVTAPADAKDTTLPIWFAISSPINQQGDVIKDQVTLQALRNLVLATDQQGQVQAGGTIVYLHTLKNLGSVTEGDAAGEVLLSLTAQNNADGFSYTLYFDANNNGTLDSTDIAATDLATITANAGLAPNQSIQLLVKVQAPSSASNGTTSQAEIVITPVGNVQGLSASILKNNDITTVNPNQLRLTKSQVIDSTCTASSFAALTYSVTPVQVKPNECVVYRLAVKNEGLSAVNTVVIQDVIPAYTTLKTPPTASASQGSVTITGDKILANVGTLTPLQEAYLYFIIRVNP